jgi:hypothetical protein
MFRSDEDNECYGGKRSAGAKRSQAKIVLHTALGAGIDSKISRREKKRAGEQTTCPQTAQATRSPLTARPSAMDSPVLSAPASGQRMKGAKPGAKQRFQRASPLRSMSDPENKNPTGRTSHNMRERIERQYHGGECRRKGCKQMTRWYQPNVPPPD